MLETSNGTITSPSFPEIYPSDKKCIWEIIAPPQYKITLNFTHFDLEGNNVCTSSSEMDFLNTLTQTLYLQFSPCLKVYQQGCEYDKVEVHSKLPENTLKRHGVYCGLRIPPLITSESNSMRVEFTSDNTIQKSGFAAVFFTGRFTTQLNSLNEVNTVTNQCTKTRHGRVCDGQRGVPARVPKYHRLLRLFLSKRLHVT